MSELKYPVGIQTFSSIIEGGWTYVDKTAYIAKLLKSKYIFLSRPRRFGKSLFLSTLEAFFEGRRELFKGLAIDSMDVDWTPSPVLHFDLNAENFSLENGLEGLLDAYLTRLENIYGSNSKFYTPAQRFQNLIENAYTKTGREVIILIDEYDKPLLDLKDNEALFEKNQRILKSFFGNLKSMDRYIRFAFLTGVGRFSKVSIFSDLNNLDDISLDNEYADICGLTEEEMLHTFRPGIEALAKERKEDFETTVRAMRSFYDGYLFASEGSRLYNPFSVLKALRSKEIKPYWFTSATPTFLVKYVKENGIAPESLDGVVRDEEDLIAVGFGQDDPVPLMFQTGYLTIGEYLPRRRRYKLRFPNQEVEIGFSKCLLPLYAPKAATKDSPLSFMKFQDDLDEGNPESFMERLAFLLKNLPGEDHKESTYRATTFLLCVLCGTEARAEHRSYKGRSDLEVETHDYIYIFEFKYNKSVSEAMEQIHERDYAGRYHLDSRKIFLIGANYSDRKQDRGLSYEIQQL